MSPHRTPAIAIRRTISCYDLCYEGLGGAINLRNLIGKIVPNPRMKSLAISIGYSVMLTGSPRVSEY